MDIEEFYDADPRRRNSGEVELGTEWSDASGIRYELSWVEDTGELYVMREPVEGLVEDPFGDFWRTRMPAKGLTVKVLTRIGDRSRLESVLSGWQEAMTRPKSTDWLVERLKSAGMKPVNGPDAEAGA